MTTKEAIEVALRDWLTREELAMWGGHYVRLDSDKCALCALISNLTSCSGCVVVSVFGTPCEHSQERGPVARDEDGNPYEDIPAPVIEYFLARHEPKELAAAASWAVLSLFLLREILEDEEP